LGLPVVAKRQLPPETTHIRINACGYLLIAVSSQVFSQRAEGYEIFRGIDTVYLHSMRSNVDATIGINSTGFSKESPVETLILVDN
jgi:hypothetical protein